MTHFVALAPQCWELTKVHFTYSRDSPGLLPKLPSWLLGSHIREFFFYAGVSGEALRRNFVISLLWLYV